MIARPAAPRPKPKLEHVWIPTAQPRNGDDGAAELGFYTVENGVLTMRDEKGKSLGVTQALGNEDPRVIAARLRRAMWLKTVGESNFNRPLDYPRWGLA